MDADKRRLPEPASDHPGVLGRLSDGPWRFHVVGAGGAGMNAIALILLELGHSVSGSDEKPSTALDRLARAGARVWVGHDAQNVQGADAVVHSSAIAATNVELVQARNLGTPVHGRAEVLAAICSLKRTLAVSGTHGKTTTTAMLSVVLEASGVRPSYLVGGDLPGGRGGALWTDGDFFVVEADESDGTFLTLPASGALVTSVEPDHMDFFGDVATL
ncbi:MAG TPA: Mur ligase domain-containing protein, partial [Acidimicrobiales bacterium]|nr:Mur ligase domain-containing protein [Acidimicrobiales bacterium]